MGTYKKFDDRIKEMVIKSGNPNLFPHLDIPRTTALYWIRESKKRIRVEDVSIEDALKDKIRDLETKLEHERAKNLFLSSLLCKLVGLKKLLNRSENREIIVRQIIAFKKWHTIKGLCELIGMRPEKFHRLKVEVIGCEKIGFRKCKINTPNQLTFKEQRIIGDLANDPNLLHMSIKGLQHYAHREGILTCGYDSWRKYVREFRIERGPIPYKKKKYGPGIRAKKPNEIWHIDITELKLKGGKKAYLQVVMDNYSRKIIKWNLSISKTQHLSLKTVKEAFRENIPEVLMSDGGGENIGSHIKRLLVASRVVGLVSKRDTHFSNSMVESFFRLLKTRFINKYEHHELARLHSLTRRVVSKYNEMPLPSLHGARPSEAHSGSVKFDQLKADYLFDLCRGLKVRREVNMKCLNQKLCEQPTN